ncbi:ABC transporter substrate-binding protein [Paractinoplanes lichenicola]|uniref:Sugar ABC transporter substrate-binding protein n=1 Tax=Paractinoplanes lichenicola TaxID=2802976 RepID=A0ABS1VFM2_9ACTN|nr:sugar ABC transporter substrate-binding protein [Actinoplanes lichenicola]MBL7253495.1 sugar ABC transporter substrate-binding protein [Actinoplanes lichenicola]
MSAVGRRTFLKAVGAAGAAGWLGACSSDDDSGGGASTSGPLSGSATFTTWANDQEAAAFKKLAADFKAARGADIKIEVLPYDQIRTVVDRRLQANEAPDLFRVSYTDVGSYAENGALADLSDHFGDSFGDAFLPALWSAVQSDGKPFGVPHHTDTSALVYNKAHFAKAGITSVPSSLDQAWTWEQFTDVLRKLKAANPGVSPFAFNYQLFGAYRWFNTLYQAGGTLLDDALENPALDSAQTRKALEFTRSLYTEGLHAPSVLVKRPTYPDEIFPTQKISMIQAGDFLIPSLDAAIKDKFEWGVTYLMRDAGAATDLGGNAVVVTDGAKNLDVAAEFAKFLVTKENMQAFCERTTVLPVRKDLADAKLAYAARPDLMPVFQQQATTMPEGLVKAATSRAFAGINQALVDTMDQYLSNPSAGTDDTVRALTDGVQKALKA